MRGGWKRHTRNVSPARGELAWRVPGETGARLAAVLRLAGNDGQTSPGSLPSAAPPAQPDPACQPPTPAPCDPCKTQPQPQCNPVSCLRSDGTNSQCGLSGPVPGQTCDCCGPTGAFCTSDFDWCSNICNVTASTC